jgi:hypothetical protein
MPVKRRIGIGRRPDLEVLTREQYDHLANGWTYFSQGYASREDAELAWEIHGDAIMESYVKEHPGRRPFGWWLFQHRKERPIVGKSFEPDEIANMRRNIRLNADHFGFLHTSIFAWPDGKTLEYLQEPERDYLERHGLLSDEELEALAAFDAAEDDDDVDDDDFRTTNSKEN